MTKIKLTKGELKRQRDSLKQFLHYLPTLQLKKQQLQMKILEARQLLETKMKILKDKETAIGRWIGLLADPAIHSPFWWDFPSGRVLSIQSLGTSPLGQGPWEEPPVETGLKPVSTHLREWIHPQAVTTGSLNIAGANIPFLKDVKFNEPDYDFYSTPLWIDQAIIELREVMRVLVEMAVIKKQIAILQHELRITTQRVNLFEKIKIPECQENIRMIRIYLGDQMANAVGISKVAKRKLETVAVV
jgi:V/A-type H+-transporting ATPase subunit D